MDEGLQETGNLPYRLVGRKKKGIAAIVTLGADNSELLNGRNAEEFARDKAEFVLQASAKLIDQGEAKAENGQMVKEFCFVKHRLELF